MKIEIKVMLDTDAGRVEASSDAHGRRYMVGKDLPPNNIMQLSRVTNYTHRDAAHNAMEVILQKFLP